MIHFKKESAYDVSERMILVKKIVPFNNVLTFNTDVYEITAISLEHDIKKEVDTISGVFYITGEYKMTAGSLDNEEFKFELPFDIALGNPYNLDTLIVDIDDFRYELLDDNRLKVNIDLYIDGEIKEESEETSDLFTEEELRELKEDTEEVFEPKRTEVTEQIDLLDEMLDNKEEPVEENISINNENDNINIFNGFNEEEKYVTYHVYPVTENDTLDKILEKYQVTKEELSKYNGSLDIHPGDKLIIPATNNDK